MGSFCERRDGPLSPCLPPRVSENGPPYTPVPGERALNSKLGSRGVVWASPCAVVSWFSFSSRRVCGGFPKSIPLTSCALTTRGSPLGLSRAESLEGAQESAPGESPGDAAGRANVGFTVLTLLGR